MVMTEKIKRISSLADTLNVSTVEQAELLEQAITARENTIAATTKRRVPGRFKDKFVVGPEFFEPLTVDDLRKLNGE
jgi:hypothetical protein